LRKHLDFQNTMVDTFSVYQFFRDGRYEAVASRVSAEEAVTIAQRLTNSVRARIGTIVRIVIADGDECCCFEWGYGRGVLFDAQLTKAAVADNAT
jgi:hypothetical protein